MRLRHLLGDGEGEILRCDSGPVNPPVKPYRMWGGGHKMLGGFGGGGGF
jgi:hypothetical protein